MTATLISLGAVLLAGYVVGWARNARRHRPDPLHHWRAR